MPSSKAPFSQSKTSNEVARHGGLPPDVRARARAIRKKNPSWSLSRCIAVAISQYKKEGNAKVVSQWEGLKARMRSS